MPREHGLFLAQTRLNWKYRTGGIYVPGGGGGGPPPGGGEWAELPRFTVPVDFPIVTGSVYSIASGAGMATIQAAFNAAQYGDAIEFAANGSWDLPGEIAMPAKSGWAPGQWITVRTSNWATLAAAWPLQADGTATNLARSSTSTNPRMTPSRANALGLPVIRVTGTTGSFKQKAGCHGWYWWGIRFVMANLSTSVDTTMVIGPNYGDDLHGGIISSMSDFPSYHVWNQCTVECPIQLRLGKGAALNLNWHAFMNGYAECHHAYGKESSAIWTGLGEGPLRWENCAFVGSAINGFIGGVHIGASGWAYHVDKYPCDGTIRYNYFLKKDNWLPSHPSYNLAREEGVKNLMEWKIGGRFLFEYNRLEGSVGNHQNGQGLTFKVLNEDYFGPGDPQPGFPAPPYSFTGPGPMYWTQTHDINCRYNFQTKCGGGIDYAGNQQTTTPQAIVDGYSDGIHDGVQLNHLHIYHNIIIGYGTGEGYLAPNGRNGINSAYLSSNPRSGGAIASWWHEHNTFITRDATPGDSQYGSHMYWQGSYEEDWPRYRNNIFSQLADQVNGRVFARDSTGTSAQALTASNPGMDIDGNVFCTPNSNSNAMGAFAAGNHFVANNAAIGLDATTGILAGGSPAKAGGLYQATDGLDNGADTAAVYAGIAGIDLI